MHAAEIQAALKLKGYSQADIARECDVKPSTVSMVINGRGRSAQVEQRIADITGYLKIDLWPSWYDAPAGKRQYDLLGKDEQLLLRSYRALQPRERAEALALVQALEAGHAVGAARSPSVYADRGGNAAGRDQIIGRTKTKAK